MAFCQAIFEEVCFRAWLQNVLARWFKGPWVAIILTAIIFSAIHISYYGFFVALLWVLYWGLCFIIAEVYGFQILFHFLYNGLQVTALYIFNQCPGQNNQKILKKIFLYGPVLIALVLLFTAFTKFQEISLAEQQKYDARRLTRDDFHNWVTPNLNIY